MRETLLELALACKPGNDPHKLMASVVPLLMRRLGCLAGSILEISIQPAKVIFSAPKCPADSASMDALLPSDLGSDFSVSETSSGHFRHCWRLGKEHLLLLLCSAPLAHNLLRDLNIVVDHLAYALELTSGRRQLELEHAKTERIVNLLESTTEINRLITSENDRDRLLTNVCKLLVLHRTYFNVWIALVVDGKPIQPFYKAGFAGDSGDESHSFSAMADHLALQQMPKCGQMALSSSGLQIILNPATECENCPLKSKYSERVGLFARLEHDGHIHGWLTVSTDREHIQDQRELDLLQQISKDIGHALSALEMAQQQRKLMQTVIKTGKMFESLGPDSELNISRIVREACELTDGAASLYNRLDIQEKSLLVWSGHNTPADLTVQDKPDGHICYEATIRGANQTVALGNLDDTSYRLSDPNVAKYGLKAYLGHPVQLHGKAIGALAVVDGKQRDFRAEEIGTIQTLARAVSLEEERLYTLKRLAHLNRILKAIRSVNHLIVHATNAESLLEQACKLLVDSRGTSNAWIILSSDECPIAPIYHAGDASSLECMANVIGEQLLPGCARHVLANGGVYRSRSLASPCLSCPMTNLCNEGENSMLTIGIEHGAEFFGWLSVLLPTEYADDPEEHSLLLEVAGDLGFSLHAIQTAKNEARHLLLLTRRQEAQSMLTAISSTLLQCSIEETDPAIEMVLGELANFAEADSSFVRLFTTDVQQLNNSHEWHRDSSKYPQGGKPFLIIDEDLPVWIEKLNKEKLVFIEDTESVSINDLTAFSDFSSLGIRSVLLVPLSIADQSGYFGMTWINQKSQLEPELTPLLQLAGNLICGAMSRLNHMREIVRREEDYRLLVDNQHDLLVKVDPQGRFEFVSPSYCKLFGKSPSELLGQAFLPIVHEDDREETLRVMDTLNSPPHRCRLEQRALTVHGWRWLEWSDTAVLSDDGAINAVIGLGRDVTDRKVIEAELRRTLEDVVHLLGSVIEHRDPYTSGHQNRVAQLARAIARKMNLSLHSIEAVYMAGLIHDLGKMAVPAEILSKPGKLASYEFALIKQHSQTGYEILKNINLPWNIATIVLQHHEKLDGSGYPNGISNDEILLESSILTVADVVEAMASHRPYRAALGVDAALNEIEKNSGQHYRQDVVSACAFLFREQKFEFE